MDAIRRSICNSQHLHSNAIRSSICNPMPCKTTHPCSSEAEAAWHWHCPKYQTEETRQEWYHPMFQQGRLRQLISLPDSLVPSLRLCFGPARLSLNKWLLSHLSALILSIPIPQSRFYCVFAIPSYAPGPPLSPITKFDNQVFFILCPNLVLIEKDNGCGNGKPDSTATTPALQPNPMLALLFCGVGYGIRILLGGDDIWEGAEVAFIANWKVGESANRELRLTDLGEDRGTETFLPLLRDGGRQRIYTAVTWFVRRKPNVEGEVDRRRRD